MASSYHGHYFRHVLERASYRLKQRSKALRASLSHRASPRKLDSLLSDLQALVEKRAWEELPPLVAAIAEEAEAAGDPKTMTAMAQASERLGDFGKAAHLRLAAHRMRKGSPADEWLGTDMRDGSLLIRLVEDDPRSLGRVIRHARLAGAAAARAGRATIQVESRMVPLLKRTFPTAEIVSSEETVSGSMTATFEQLIAVFANDAERLAADFTPLRADPQRVAAFREKYRRSTDRPLVGLSWGSKSHAKDVPDLHEWARFIAATPATFVSLQYGDIQPAVRRLRDGDPDRLILDQTVDQMVDMDTFAAQMGALDAVVTISNTAAHLAGALGLPTVFIIDDLFHTAWPVLGERTPWYPTGIVIRKEGRDWPTVLEEARRHLQSMIEKDKGAIAASRRMV